MYSVNKLLSSSLDIHRGEKYLYVNSSLARLRDRYPKAKIIMFYDIACKVEPHLQVSDDATFYLT